MELTSYPLYTFAIQGVFWLLGILPLGAVIEVPSKFGGGILKSKWISCYDGGDVVCLDSAVFAYN